MEHKAISSTELLRHHESSSIQSLEALVHWLQYSASLVSTRDQLEHILLEPKNVAKIVHVFNQASELDMVELLAPFATLLSSSAKFGRACSAITPALLSHLRVEA